MCLIRNGFPLEGEPNKRIDNVQNAVVFGRRLQNGDQNIVAVLEISNQEIEKVTVLQECRKSMPSYMVPHEIYFEKTFKKTANDKIDRAFLKEKWLAAEGKDEA